MPAPSSTERMGHSYGVRQKVSVSHNNLGDHWGRTANTVVAINNITLTNILKDWYLGFVLNLDPNSICNSGTPKPYWPQYQAPTNASSDIDFSIMSINYTMMGVSPDVDANSRCDFFHGQSYVVRN